VNHAVLRWHMSGENCVAVVEVFRDGERFGSWRFSGESLPQLLWRAVSVAAGVKARVVEVVGEGDQAYPLPWLRGQIRAEADRKLASLFGDREGQEEVIDLLVGLLAVVRERSTIGSERR